MITVLLRKDWYEEACRFLGYRIDVKEHDDRFYDATLDEDDWRSMNDHLLEWRQRGNTVLS